MDDDFKDGMAKAILVIAVIIALIVSLLYLPPHAAQILAGVVLGGLGAGAVWLLVWALNRVFRS